MTETLSIIATLTGMLAFYILLAVGLLRLGARLQKHYPRVVGSRFAGTVHVLALIAFLIGCLLTWMVHSSGYPINERQLVAPLILVLLVYGVVLITWVRTAGLAIIIRMVTRIFSGSNDSHGL